VKHKGSKRLGFIGGTKLFDRHATCPREGSAREFPDFEMRPTRIGFSSAVSRGVKSPAGRLLSDPPLTTNPARGACKDYCKTLIKTPRARPELNGYGTDAGQAGWP
jgi:hypothetical protein